jgi:hypothetical protein
MKHGEIRLRYIDGDGDPTDTLPLLSLKELKGLRVDVYRNLRKKCWSIRAMEGRRKGRVVAHADSLHLYHCKFHVSEAGRQRVLREKKKNVHAWVSGYFSMNSIRPNELGHVGVGERYFTPEPIKYNPYQMKEFQTLDGVPCSESPRVNFYSDGSATTLIEGSK